MSTYLANLKHDANVLIKHALRAGHKVYAVSAPGDPPPVRLVVGMTRWGDYLCSMWDGQALIKDMDDKLPTLDSLECRFCGLPIRVSENVADSTLMLETAEGDAII